MQAKLPEISELIRQIKKESMRSPLRAAGKYLTPLAIRSIVEYIIELEGSDGK